MVIGIWTDRCRGGGGGAGAWGSGVIDLGRQGVGDLVGSIGSIATRPIKPIYKSILDERADCIPVQ